MENEPSRLLLDQRVRNRIIDATDILADGVDGLRLFGVGGYFNFFFDWVPDDGNIPPNSAMSAEEREQLLVLRRLVVAACDDIPAITTEDGMIETGWLDEENEELEPSA